MTRLDLIKMVGEALTKLDLLRGSISPEDPNREPLDRLRKRLDGLQLQLSKNEFDIGTAEFELAAGNLASINRSLRRTINDVGRVVNIIENLQRFANAVSDIIVIAMPFI